MFHKTPDKLKMWHRTGLLYPLSKNAKSNMVIIIVWTWPGTTTSRSWERTAGEHLCTLSSWLHTHLEICITYHNINVGLFEQFDTCNCSECHYNGVSKWQHWPAQPESHSAPQPREEVHTLDNIVFLRPWESVIFMNYNGRWSMFSLTTSNCTVLLNWTQQTPLSGPPATWTIFSGVMENLSRAIL